MIAEWWIPLDDRIGLSRWWWLKRKGGHASRHQRVMVTKLGRRGCNAANPDSSPRQCSAVTTQISALPWILSTARVEGFTSTEGSSLAPPASNPRVNRLNSAIDLFPGYVEGKWLSMHHPTEDLVFAQHSLWAARLAVENLSIPISISASRGQIRVQLVPRRGERNPSGVVATFFRGPCQRDLGNVTKGPAAVENTTSVLVVLLEKKLRQHTRRERVPARNEPT
ncbi:hypothetical protein DFH06DRAFT_1301943 [Mycena polygramma]|nr:hypothetical protein DFH06DRAFT_1301943 [Mycena polygramma]